MMKMTVNPPSVFETEVKEHMNKCAHRYVSCQYNMGSVERAHFVYL